MKKTLPDGVVVYTYGETKTIHTTHPNGLSVIEFPNGQVEKHLPDGSQEIVFPDQTFKYSQQHISKVACRNLNLRSRYISPGGEEQAVFRNGTVITLFRDGRKETEFSNGQKETLCVARAFIPIRLAIMCATSLKSILTPHLQVSRWHKGARVS